jgi:hypothetical protein
LPGQPRGSGASRGGQAGDGCFGLAFELKGGTSLSKGFGIIHRFSEDIDIRIEPFDGLKVDTNPNHENPQHIDSRRLFFEKLREKINIPGITAVERETHHTMTASSETPVSGYATRTSSVQLQALKTEFF